MNKLRMLNIISCLIALYALMPTAALAYIGPGAGLGLVGTFFGLTWAVGLGVVLTVLWPVLWFWRRAAEKKSKQVGQEAAISPREKE